MCCQLRLRLSKSFSRRSIGEPGSGGQCSSRREARASSTAREACRGRLPRPDSTEPSTSYRAALNMVATLARLTMPSVACRGLAELSDRWATAGRFRDVNYPPRSRGAPARLPGSRALLRGCVSRRLAFVASPSRDPPRPAFQRHGNLRYLGPGSILGRRADSPQQAAWPAAQRTSQQPAEIIEPLRRGAWRSLASALDWGSRGRRFKSCRPDLGSPIAAMICDGAFS